MIADENDGWVDETPVETGGGWTDEAAVDYAGKLKGLKKGDLVAVAGRDGKVSLKKMNAPVDGASVLEDVDGEPETGRDYPTLTADEWDAARENGDVRMNVSPSRYRRLQQIAESGSDDLSAFRDTAPFIGRAVSDDIRHMTARMERFVKGAPDLSRAMRPATAVTPLPPPPGFKTDTGPKSESEAWGREAAMLGVKAVDAKRRDGEDDAAYRERLIGLVREQMEKRVSRQDRAKRELSRIEKDWKDTVFGEGRQSLGYGLEFAATAPFGGLVGKAPATASRLVRIGRGVARVAVDAQPVAIAHAVSDYEKFRENGYTMRNGQLEVESRGDDPERALFKAIANNEIESITEIGLGELTAPILRGVGRVLGRRAWGKPIVGVAKGYAKIREATKFGDILFEELPEEDVQYFFSDVLGLGKKDSEYKGFFGELAESRKDGGMYTLEGQWNTALAMLLQMGGQAAVAAPGAGLEHIKNNRELANILEGAGMTKEQVAGLSYSQREAFRRFHDRFADNPEKLKEALTRFDKHLSGMSDDLVRQTTFKTEKAIRDYKDESGNAVAPHYFEVQTENGPDGKPRPKFSQTISFRADGKTVTRNSMTDPKAQVTIVDNGVDEDGNASYEIYDEIHPERSFATSDFTEAQHMANLYALSNQKLRLDNERKAEYARMLLEGGNAKYGGNHEVVGSVRDVLALFTSGMQNNNGSFHGVSDLKQIFQTDEESGELLYPPRLIAGNNSRGFATPDGTRVIILDNIRDAASMREVLSHEGSHALGKENAAERQEMLKRVSPDSELGRLTSQMMERNKQLQKPYSEDYVRDEALSVWMSQRGHNPSAMQRLSHKLFGKVGQLNDTDMEVIAANAEREMSNESGEVHFLDEDYADTRTEAVPETPTQQENQTSETRTDEAPAQPEPGAERPAEPEAPRPVAGAETGAEAPRDGVVESSVPEAAEVPQSEAAEAVKPGKPVQEQPQDMPQGAKDEAGFLRVMHNDGPLVRIPVARMKTPDTQFKEDADPVTGVVEKDRLQGEYFESAENAIALYLTKDEEAKPEDERTYEVGTGRHRLDLARRNGIKSVLSRVFKESDGYTRADIRNLDAISNIIDEKGSVKDYVNYFSEAKPSREAAEAGGFLSRPKGRLAFGIYEGATEDTRASIDWKGSGADGLISVEQAGIIAEAAPKQAGLQRILVRKALDGLRGKKLAVLARSLAEEAKSRRGTPDVGGGMQLDLFTSEEDQNLLALEERRADYRVRRAREYARIAEVLRTAIAKGGKLDLNADYAKELGITDPDDKKQLAAARDKAVERANYWENAVRLDDDDKAAMDAEINAAAERPAEYLAWLEKYKMTDTDKRFAEWQRKQGAKTDAQGNPVDANGKLRLEPVERIADLTDEDFTKPTRNVQLPKIPANIDAAIGADGKPVIIKRNIFEKNAKHHPELSASDGKSILERALYNPNLVGQTQPVSRPTYKVAIQTGDRNAVTVLEVSQTNDNVEIIGWRNINERGLELMKKQAAKEGGQLLVLHPSENGQPVGLSGQQRGLTGESISNRGGEGNGDNVHETNVARAAEIIAEQARKNTKDESITADNVRRGAESLVTAIENRDANALRSRFNGLNKGSVKAFEAITGLKMPSTQKGQHEVVDRFCGISPEERTRIDAAREAEAKAVKEARRKEQSLRDGENAASRFRVRLEDGKVATAKELVGERGWQVRVGKRGAVNETWIIDPKTGMGVKVKSEMREYLTSLMKGPAKTAPVAVPKKTGATTPPKPEKPAEAQKPLSGAREAAAKVFPQGTNEAQINRFVEKLFIPLSDVKSATLDDDGTLTIVGKSKNGTHKEQRIFKDGSSQGGVVEDAKTPAKPAPVRESRTTEKSSQVTAPRQPSIKMKDEAAEKIARQQEDDLAALFDTPELSPVTPADDAAYMDAVRRGDMETAQKMVDEADKQNGYTVDVYHGTQHPGFFKFKDDETGGVYVSSNMETSKTYVQEVFGDYGGIDVLPVIEKFGSRPDMVRKAKASGRPGIYHLALRPGRTLTVDAHGKSWNELSEADGLPEEIGSIAPRLHELIAVRDYDDNGNRLIILRAVENEKDLDDESYPSVLREYGKFKGWTKEETENYNPELVTEQDYSIGGEVVVAYNYPMSFSGISELNAFLQRLSPSYKVTEEDFDFETDEYGYKTEVPDGEPSSKHLNPEAVSVINTRRVAAFAEDNGYDSVHFQNVVDNGGYGDADASDVWWVRKSNQLKMRNPVTYDDAGNVIPLSQRFNPQNEDIRFDTPELADEQIIGKLDNEKKFLDWTKKWKLDPSKKKNQREWANRNGVSFDTKTFDPDMFQKRVGAVAKLVKTYQDNGVADFKTLVTRMSERFPEKFATMKPYLRGVWNAVADQMDLDEVSRGQAERVFGIIEAQAKEATNEPADNGTDGGVRPATDRGEQPGGVLADRPVREPATDERVDGERPGAVSGLGNRLAEGEVPQSGGDGQRGTAEGNVSVGDKAESASGESRDERDRSEDWDKTPARIRKRAAKAADSTKPNSPRRDFVMTKAVEEAILEKKTANRVRNNLDAIKLIRELKARDYAATPEEQATLAKFVGWGGLREAVFGYDLERAYDLERSGEPDRAATLLRREGISQSAYELHKELRQVLNDKEYESAKESASTAFYTPIEFVRVLHETLRRLGVKGGRFLGPSAGTGNFASAAGAYEKPVNWQFVEKDAMTGEMLKALFPNQRVNIGGFEDTKFPDGFFDFAIDNVPYADVPINDRSLSSRMFKIHDYFFAKTLAKLRPGGVMAFLTSTGTLDKTSPILRQFLTEHGGRIVGAVRLPNGFFSENAGTDVASDLVIVQKVHGKPDNSAFEKGVEYGSTTEWVRRKGKVKKPLTYNGYFKDHPEQIVGEMTVGSGQFGPTLQYKMPEGDMWEQVRAAVQNAFAGIDHDALLKEAAVAQKQDHTPIYDDEGLRQGNVTMKDGKPFIKSGEMLEPISLPSDRSLNKELAKRFKSPKSIMDGLMDLRKAMRDVIDAQMADSDVMETDLAPLQAKLNETYDAFVKKNGSLHDKWISLFVLLDKADGNRLLALERIVKDESGKPKIVKSDIFTKRVISRGQRATRAETPKDALVICYSEMGGINIPRIATLLDTTEEEAIDRLKEGGDVFENPQTGLLEPSWGYLSGRVRAKLAAARAAVEAGEESFRANVEALEKVQPPMVRLEDAEIKFGATWVDPECMADFLRDAFGSKHMRINLSKNDVTGQWNVEFGHIMNEDPWGETSWDPKEFVSRVLNHGSMNHYVTDPVDKKRYLDERRTEANKLAAEKLHSAFSQFIQSSEKWATPMYERYNAVMTDMVEIQLPNNILPFRSAGMSEDALGKLFEGGDPKTPKKGREYQSAVIARGVLGNGSLCLAHCVGAGKTLEMQSIGVLGRHLGLFKKPMYVVPNHMLEQFTNEFVEAFPNANILKMSEDDVKPENRRAFFAQVANGDWDAIVVKHSTFSKKLAMSEEYQKEFIEAQRRDLIEAIAAMRESGEKISVDQATKKLERLEAKLEQLANAENHDSQIVPFEELGVDQLFVDEAHNFKGMPITTRQGRTGGLSQGDSQRAVDMQMKAQYVQSLHGGDRGVVFATGTPLSNAPVVEAFVMLKYLAPKKLEEQGLKHFDDFVDAFGRITTESEFSLDGRSVKEKEKVSAFVNIPELMKLLRSVVDIVNPDQLDIPRPKPKYHMIDVDMSPVQERIMEMVAREAATPPSREERNKYLTLTRIAKNACLTPRLLGFEDGGNKIIRAVAEIKRVYDETADNRGAQLVFTDIFNRAGGGTDEYISSHIEGDQDMPYARGAYNLNEEIRDLLVAAGIPEEEIAIVQDIDKSKGDKDANKGALFAKVRAGEVRVLIGSRPKMGEGTNVQERLAAIHLLHPGWKPSEDEQAIGRIIRYGNSYKEGQIFYYLTKGNAEIGSYETKNHQLIGVKSKLIDQVMHGDDSVREIVMDESAMDRDMLMGLASGNKALMELIDVKKRVHKLELNTESTMTSARRNKDRAEANSRILERKREEFARGQEGAREWREKNAGKPFALSTPDGRSLDKVKDMAEHVAGEMTRLLTKDRYDRDERTVLGDFNGVELVLAYDKWGGEKFTLAVPLLGVAREIGYSGFIPDFTTAAMTAFKGRLFEAASPDYARAVEAQFADMDRQAKKMSADADRLQKDYETMRGELIKLRTRQAELERAVTPLVIQTVEKRNVAAYGNWAIVKERNGHGYVAQREADAKRLTAPTVKELIPLMDAEDFANPKNAAAKTADLRNRLKPNSKGEYPNVETLSVAQVDFDTPGIYTGSAADYANRSRRGGVDDGPSIKKIGTGEGAQVYGWGLYGSTVRGVAEKYATPSGLEIRRHGKVVKPWNDKIAGLIRGNFSSRNPIEAALNVAKENGWDQKDIESLENGDYEVVASHANIYEQTFFTNRAPGDESHLLKWYEPVSEEQLGWIKGTARKEGISLPMLEETLQHIVKDGKDYGAYDNGDDIYDALIQDLGSPQAASEFLYRAGIDGIKYPVDSYGGKGVKDGDKAGWNYVAFSDEHIRVDHKWVDGVLQFDTPELAPVTPDDDAAYMDAVRRGDMETAQRMVREAAASQGWHEKSTKETLTTLGITANTFDEFQTFARIWISGEQYAVSGKTIEDRKFDSLKDAVKYLADNGFDGRISKGIFDQEFSSLPDSLKGVKFYQSPSYTVYHHTTKQIYDYIQSKKTADTATGESVYIRFGKLPKGGRSRNYAEGFDEPGVSVFTGVRLRDGSVFVIPETPQQLGTLIHARAQGRPVFIATGDVNGRGSDGEPTLAKAKIVPVKEYTFTPPTFFVKDGAVKRTDVTYDDAGNVIPLSQRFNPQNPDINFDTPDLSPAEEAYSEAEDKTPTEKVMREVYGMTNDDIATAMKAAGMEPPKHVRKSDATAWQQAEALLSNPSYMAKLSRAVARFPRNIADYENNALNVLFRQRQNAVNEAQSVVDGLKETLDAFAAIPKDEQDTDFNEEQGETADDYAEAKARLAQAKALMFETGSALTRSSSEAGRRLRSNRGLIDQADYSYAGISAQIADALGGADKITPEMDARIREIAAEFAALDQNGREIATVRLKAQAEKIVEQIKNAGKVRRAVERKPRDEARRVTRNYNDALAQIEVGAAEVGGTLVGLSDQQYPAWGRWLRAIGEYHCFANPAITEEECVNAIVEDISPFIETDANAVRAALTGFGHNFRQSRYDSQRLMNDLRSQSRLKRQLDWMDDTNTMPPLTGLVRDEPSDTTRNLQQRVQARKAEIPDEGRDERRLKGVLDSAKTRVRNRIADLERAIETGEKIPARDRTVPEDIELRELKRRRDELKETYDELFKPERGMTDEQRISLAEKLLARELEHALEDLDRARSGDFSKRPKRPGVTSPALAVLRDRLNEVRGQIRKLKAAKYEFGMTPEELEAYNARKMANREKAIARLAERVANGDLRPQKKPQPPMPPEMQKRYDELAEQMKKARQKLADIRLDAENATAPTFVRKARDYLRFVTTAQRALRATMDFSSVLRQAARITLAHPVMGAKSFGKAWNAAHSEANLTAVNDEIMSDPSIQEAVAKYGLHLREVDAASDRDVEMFHGMERNKVRIFGREFAITDIPFFGGFMLKSERHYLTYLNAMSADLYTSIVNGIPGGATPWQKKMIADMINIWNGSAALSKERRQALQKAWVNDIFWAPQLAISRVQSAVGYDWWHPLVAKGIKNADGSFDKVSNDERRTAAKVGLREHLRSTVAMLAIGALLKWLFSDDDDKYDFSQADWFEKMMMLVSPKIGNTTIDLTGGESTFNRLVHQLATKSKRSGTGRLMKFGDFNGPTTMGTIGRYLQGKLSPSASAIVALWEGKDYVGEEYGAGKMVWEMLVPLTFEDVKDQIVQNGVGKSLVTIPLSLLGAGGSTYDRKPYENAVNRFLEAKKEYDAIEKDDLIDERNRKLMLDSIIAGNPLMREGVREDIAADIARIRRDEARARKGAKGGVEPDADLLSGIETGKARLLEKIRTERRR